MSPSTLPPVIAELTTAEEFLDFFEIPYDQEVVKITRLHILQRFHDYLHKADLTLGDEPEKLAMCRELLAQAYDDFVRSEPLKERVFKVLKEAPARAQTKRGFVALSDVGGVAPKVEGS